MTTVGGRAGDSPDPGLGGRGTPLPGAPPADAPTTAAVAVSAHPLVGVPGVGGPVRRGMRVSRPPRHPRWLIDQLPVGMAQHDFFVRFVGIFQEVASTLLDDADMVEHVADATVTPVPLLEALAGWIGVDSVDASLPEDLQRLIVRSSARSLARRGTADGLREFVQMLSGGPATIDDGGGVWREGEAPRDVAWVRIEVAGTGHLTDSEFVALLRDEVPAHVRVELWVAGRRALSTVEDDR